MADLKIRIYRGGKTEQETTVSVPGGVLRIASRLIPNAAKDALQEKGVDFDEIVRLAEDPEAHGTLVEVEEHSKDEKIVVALE